MSDITAQAPVKAPAKRRIDHADTIRGVCILLVNYFHSNVSFFALKYVSTICVHPFLFMAGYFYSGKGTLGDTFKKKLRTLIVPYYVLGLAYYLLWLLFSFNSGQDLLAPLKAVLYMPIGGFPIEPSLYFLPVMFFSGMILAVIIKFVKNEYLRLTIVVVITLIGNFWNDQLHMRLPMSLDCAFAVLLYFYLGFHGRKILAFTDSIVEKLRYRWLKLLVFVVLSVINIALIEYNYIPNILQANWGIEPLTHFNTCLLMLLWVYFFRFTETLGFLKYVNKALKYIGTNSILFMCFSHMGLKVSGVIMSFLPIPNMFLYKTLYCVISLLVIVPVIELFNRTKLHYIFGK